MRAEVGRAHIRRVAVGGLQLDLHEALCAAGRGRQRVGRHLQQRSRRRGQAVWRVGLRRGRVVAVRVVPRRALLLVVLRVVLLAAVLLVRVRLLLADLLPPHVLPRRPDALRLRLRLPARERALVEPPLRAQLGPLCLGLALERLRAPLGVGTRARQHRLDVLVVALAPRAVLRPHAALVEPQRGDERSEALVAPQRAPALDVGAARRALLLAAVRLLEAALAEAVQAVHHRRGLVHRAAADGAQRLLAHQREHGRARGCLRAAAGRSAAALRRGHGAHQVHRHRHVAPTRPLPREGRSDCLGRRGNGARSRKRASTRAPRTEVRTPRLPPPSPAHAARGAARRAAGGAAHQKKREEDDKGGSPACCVAHGA